MVESQVGRLSCKNDHLRKELAVIANLSEQLQKGKHFLLNTTDKELEEEKGICLLELILYSDYFNIIS